MELIDVFWIGFFGGIGGASGWFTATLVRIFVHAFVKAFCVRWRDATFEIAERLARRDD